MSDAKPRSIREFLAAWESIDYDRSQRDKTRTSEDQALFSDAVDSGIDTCREHQPIILLRSNRHCGPQDAAPLEAVAKIVVDETNDILGVALASSPEAAPVVLTRETARALVVWLERIGFWTAHPENHGFGPAEQIEISEPTTAETLPGRWRPLTAEDRQASEALMRRIVDQFSEYEKLTAKRRESAENHQPSGEAAPPNPES